MRATLAGLIYFAVVFAAGFCLGTLRVLVLAPAIGESEAVALELPIILTASWFTCRWICATMSVPQTPRGRMLMGVVALLLLLAAEVAVSVLGFGRTVAAHLEQYRHWPALLGFAGQIVFAAFPLLQRGRVTT